MRPIATMMIAVLLLAATAHAQGGMGGYDKMSVEAGEGALNFKTGAIDKLTGAVKIRLTDSTGKEPPLPIDADAMTFSFKEGATQPSRILMNGNVYIKHPQATVRAQHADYNLDSGDVVFTGGPYVILEGGSEVRGSEIAINMNDGTTRIKNMDADEINTESMGNGGSSDPTHLNAIAVTDWTALAAALKADVATEEASPTRHLLAHIDQTSFVATLQGMTPEAIVGQKDAVLKLMNGAIDKPALYDEAAWQGRTIGDEATALLGKETREAAEEKQLNRLLIEAAYPAAFGG